MLLAFKLKKFAAVVTFAAAGIFASAAPAWANNDLRQDLEDALSNIETVHLKLKALGQVESATEGLLQIDAARKALANTSDEVLTEASKTIANMEQLMYTDELILDAMNIVESQAQGQNARKPLFAAASKSVNQLSSLVHSTNKAEVDTEFLDIAVCADQMAMQGTMTGLKTAFYVAGLAADIVPEDLVTLGQSIPNPVKTVLTVVKYAADALVFGLEQGLAINAICMGNNDTTVLQEYVQARQVRYTPHKTLEAKFDVVRPVNLGGNKKFRYTFWMHVTEDGRPANAEVTKVLASELSDANSDYVEMPSSLYTVEYKSKGLYKLTFDTPTAQGLDYVRGFVVHLEDEHLAPAGVTYFHNGVGHIRSDVNARDF